VRALLALVALVLGAFRAPAQARPTTPSAAPAPSSTDSAQLAQEIAQHRAQGERYLPDADNFTMGSRSIAAGTAVDGPIAVARGTLDVFGTIRGDAIVLDGTIHVHPGARITGDTYAVGGSVVIDGGLVEGQKRAIAFTPPATAPARPREPMGTWETVKLVIGWFALLTIIGLGVMIFAESNLDGVVVALERGFARSFWIGLAGQVVALPALLVLVVALAITVLGVLLIPFAIVAYVIAAAGLMTLGFLAVARLTGDGLASSRGTTSTRGVHLRGLAIGLAVYLALWLVAALFAWSPVVGAILRTIAVALTWVAMTVGLGATLVSRAGTERATGGAKATTDEFAWQTPTPVSGVAAATRKVVARR
jgi:hypothetical protein